MASLPPPVDSALAGAMQEWFFWLHRHPELSFHEQETAAFVASTLRHLGYFPRERVGVGPSGEPLHGVVAVLGAERRGPALALRADMDALPLAEASGLPYSSDRPGVMHACGHDAHTAMLLGAAAALKAQDARQALPGPVVLLFQPAEEVPPGGALGMIEAGVLESPPVGAVFGLHQSTRDVGTFSIAAGPRNAASDGFRITVTGRGGHAAWPQRTVDPILVAAHMVVALQGIVSRQIAPRQAAVLTVGVIEGGTKENVIPETVTLRGTVRTLDEEVREQMPGRIKTIAEGIAAAFGATVDVDYRRGYDVLINDPDMSVLASQAAADVVGEERIQPAEAGMGGEDFGRYLLKVPGCFATIGAGTPEVPQEERVGGHSPRFALDPACLPYGVAWYVAVARRYFALRAANS
ncbi:MAG: amidohydrolase [Chloroflexota bacterium]|nr:amidohydrolase [Chloroflexota bacterium]